MTQNNELLSEIYNGPWLERALYVAENRAIPSVIDGLKPVQRYLLYSGFKNCKNSFSKVAGVGSVVSVYGYHHGEGSAQTSLSEMGKDYSNNLPLFVGDGAFGSILSPIPAAARYIYVKLAPYIDDLFLDTDIAPIHEDPEHIPPKYYLPIIPMVLVNGIKGIATGYATNIPPYSAYDIIDCMRKKIKTGKFEEPTPTFYKFTGKVEKTNDGYTIKAPYEILKFGKIRITDLPFGNTSESYESFLRKLLEKDMIGDYENNSANEKFDFVIIMKRGTRWTKEEIETNLRLTISCKYNLTTVSEQGKIQEWKSVSDIINYFYDFRLGYIKKRIENNIEQLKRDERYYTGLIGIINSVIDGSLNLKDMKEEELKVIIRTKYNVPDEYVQKILDMPFKNFTAEKIEDLSKKLNDVVKELKRLMETTPEKEYLNDLSKLEKSIRKADIYDKNSLF